MGLKHGLQSASSTWGSSCSLDGNCTQFRFDMPRATNSTTISDIIIDSGQTDLINYSYAPWTFITGNSTYVNETATITTTSSVDQKVRYEIRFSFTGTQVAVYGSFPDSMTLGLGVVTDTRSSYTLFVSARTMTTTSFQPLLVGEEDHVLFYQVQHHIADAS
ncbi:hypothetical protein OH76DRAFT_944239 [Lentinus brumalis]|uniref:Uncharacterized protein n=1 Tax=Lentinus brumalis TaxID=2498619 RepID=A0A371CZ55_9APHY|nr:hypothetical protein OH76DRAFT_944239 [Polyporus brumalis]